MDIVVEYENKEYKFYEPGTDTLLVSQNLSEGFSNFSKYLKSVGAIKGSILEESNIRYHLDSKTFMKIVESNVNLLKRLQTGQSEFKTSQDKFGGSFEKSSLGQKAQGAFGKSAEFGDSFRKSDKKWKT